MARIEQRHLRHRTWTRVLVHDDGREQHLMPSDEVKCHPITGDVLILRRRHSS